MIGYTFGAAGILLALVAMSMLLAVKAAPAPNSNRDGQNSARYGAVTLAIIFGTASVVMFIIGQAWLWEHQ